MTAVEQYRFGEGLRREPTAARYEAKEPDAEFTARAEATCALPDSPQKRAAALEIYAASQAIPITVGRTQDPTEPDKIVEWCPILLSPFTYRLPEDLAARQETAERYLAALDGFNPAYIALLFAFAKDAGANFTQADAVAFLAAHRDVVPDSARAALENIEVYGQTPETAGRFANPYRLNADSLLVGAVFGIRYAGRPEVAARLAMVFASVTHFKGGVYAAMFMAGLFAHAACITDPEVYVQRSLSCLPIPSPFFRSVAYMQRNLNCNVTRDECVKMAHDCCDPADEWVASTCYANAMSVAAALVYSGSDSELSSAVATVGLMGYQTARNETFVRAVQAMIRG